MLDVTDHVLNYQDFEKEAAEFRQAIFQQP